MNNIYSILLGRHDLDTLRYSQQCAKKALAMGLQVVAIHTNSTLKNCMCNFDIENSSLFGFYKIDALK